MALLSLSGSGSLALAVNLSLSSFGWTQALAVKLALTVADKTNKMAPTLINTATRFLLETYLSILNAYLWRPVCSSNLSRYSVAALYILFLLCPNRCFSPSYFS